MPPRDARRNRAALGVLSSVCACREIVMPVSNHLLNGRYECFVFFCVKIWGHFLLFSCRDATLASIVWSTYLAGESDSHVVTLFMHNVAHTNIKQAPIDPPQPCSGRETCSKHA